MLTFLIQSLALSNLKSVASHSGGMLLSQILKFEMPLPAFLRCFGASISRGGKPTLTPENCALFQRL